MFESKVTLLNVGRAQNLGSRRQQQDAFAYETPSKDAQYLSVAQRKGNLFVVADGVGGEEAGEIASQLAVAHIIKEFYRDPSADIEQSLKNAIDQANQQIIQQSGRFTSRGMFTTIVVALIRGTSLWVAHVGDSRAYLIRGGQIDRLTRDHKEFPSSHSINRALGYIERAKPDLTQIKLHERDLILLCSDGLYDALDDEQIANMTEAYPPQEAASRLTDLASSKRDADNVTVIVIALKTLLPVTPPENVPFIAYPVQDPPIFSTYNIRNYQSPDPPARGLTLLTLLLISLITLCFAVLLTQSVSPIAEPTNMPGTSTKPINIPTPILNTSPTPGLSIPTSTAQSSFSTTTPGLSVSTPTAQSSFPTTTPRLSIPTPTVP